MKVKSEEVRNWWLSVNVETTVNTKGHMKNKSGMKWLLKICWNNDNDFEILNL